MLLFLFVCLLVCLFFEPEKKKELIIQKKQFIVLEITVTYLHFIHNFVLLQICLGLMRINLETTKG